jgi:tagaturonate reductase
MLKKLNRSTTSLPPLRPTRILQFGEGNFLRAFVDWMVDILNEKTDFNSAVEIIQPIRKGLGEMLNAQDGLYHVLLKGMQHGNVFSEERLITCVSNVINPYEDFKRFLKTAENPDLQFIISNTTEAGISFDETDSDPEKLSESFPGKLTQLLHHRFQYFKGDTSKGLILLPCELIERNGEALKKTVLAYCDLWKLSSAFKNWITEHNIFCNTLVDRIVPGFPKETIQEIQQSLGYEDNLVVQAEPFHLWVIEGPSSVQQYLPAEKTGLHVKFTSDLTPYRTRKVRILNGAHTTLVPVAYLAGLRLVKESVDDKAIGTYIRRAIFNEIIPTLDLSADELSQFANDVIERFQNPFIKHELLSIALNSISKFKVRVLPSILEYKKRTNKLPEDLLHSLAVLILFYKGEWEGNPIPLNDSPEILEFFRNAWQDNNVESVVNKVLSNESFWGQDLTKIEGFERAMSNSLRSKVMV